MTAFLVKTVSHHHDFPDDDVEHDEIGFFDTLEDANAFVRHYPIDEWGSDYTSVFDSFEWTEEPDGRVRFDSVDMEGGTFSMEIVQIRRLLPTRL